MIQNLPFFAFGNFHKRRVPNFRSTRLQKQSLHPKTSKFIVPNSNEIRNFIALYGLVDLQHATPRLVAIFWKIAP